jgi:hypothetical protein
MNGGGGNCTRDPSDTSCFSGLLCDECTQGLSDLCRDCVALRELVASWHRLTPTVRKKILDVAQTTT